jgi:hypothetical protein
MYGWGPTSAVIAFEMLNRRVKFELPLPDRDSQEFKRTPTGRVRAPKQQEEVYEQAVRQRWRALALVIKAKLEAVESGITLFEEEFLSHIVLPDGKTVGKHMLPKITEAYESGKMPSLLSKY